MYDVAIIGAGAVGALTARRLSAYDIRVCVLEKENDAAVGASKANSGIVHAGFDAVPGTLKARLNVRGSELMERIVSELGVGFRRNGSLVIGFDENEYDTICGLYERGKKNAVKGLRVLDGEQLREKEPSVSERALFALYAPSAAIVCPYELTIAALGNAMDNSVEFKRGFEVADISDTGSGYEISSSGETVRSRFVINAAGIYADKIAALAGDESIKIRPRRGEYILLDKAHGIPVTHTLFKVPTNAGKGILVTPTVDGNLLMGPTSEELYDKTDKSVTAEGLAKIKEQAASIVDGIPFGSTITSFCGLRAAEKNGDFIINSPKPGFINAAGIDSPGLSASPAIAELIEELLKEQGLGMRRKPEYDPFREPMHRFREADNNTKNEMIRSDPAYGRIICRCEGVTEGEIIDALRRAPGAVDLDGIKRRTRAQMGRCQGGFCMPSVAEIISRELNVPFEHITKSGKNSRLVMEEIK